MSENKCKCDLRTKPVGDGCRYCNPQDYIDHLHDALAAREWVGLTQQDIDIAFDDTQEGGGFDDFARAIEAKLREKNA